MVRSIQENFETALAHPVSGSEGFRFLPLLAYNFVILDSMIEGAVEMLRIIRREHVHLHVAVCAAERDADLTPWLAGGAHFAAGGDEATGEVMLWLQRALVTLQTRSLSTAEGWISVRPGFRRARHPAHGLTRREAEICRLLNEGLSNKQLGRRLAISEATVKNHIHSILQKLDVRSRWQAAAWADQEALAPKA